MEISRRSFLATAMGTALASAGMPRFVSAQQAKRPNFLFILTDDQGYGDLGSMNHPVIKTPNLDRLAAASCLMTDFYTCSPVCAPARAGCMTGRDPNRFGLKFLCHNGQYDAPVFHHVPRDEPMLPRQLQAAGYRTGHICKWHMSLYGYAGEPSPADYGFDHALTQVGPGMGRGLYKNPTDWTRNGEKVEGKLADWTPNLCIDESIRFIQESGDRPFFLNLWPFTPHEDVITPEEYRELYEGRTEQEKTYYGSITHLDHELGRLFQFLESEGLADNTVVIFTSDNGPADPGLSWVKNSTGSTGPFRGAKGSLYEGGIRVPTLVHWPGVTEPGSVSSVPATLLDLFPTLCAAAGAEMPVGPAYDGVDIRPALRGETVKREHPLYWEFERAAEDRFSPPLAIRENQWKLLCDTEYENAELYNLDFDMGEKWNLAGLHPEITERLVGQIRSFREGEILPDAEDAVFLNPNMPPPNREQLVLG